MTDQSITERSMSDHPVYVIGRGPSLARLRAEDITDPEAPVITLNRAILWVRRLGLPNPIYAMQKDGCIPHTFLTGPPLQDPAHLCDPERIVRPLAPEIFVTSAAEGLYCQKDYPSRIVVDVALEYGLPWHTMSLPVAVEFAYWMLTASDIVTFACDSMTHGDVNTLQDDGSLVESPHAGYFAAASAAKERARERGIPIRWR
jgi:hypothetical protein